MFKELEELQKECRENKIPTILDEGLNELLEVIKSVNPKKILEIGTAYGVSGIAMLKQTSATLTTVEINEESYFKAKKNFEKMGVKGRVTQILGDCVEVVPKLTSKYDFIFLDGPKGHYAEMLPYLKDLLAIGGVIFADNMLFKGYVKSENPPKKHTQIVRSLREYLKSVEEDENFISTLLDLGDGISIATKVK